MFNSSADKTQMKNIIFKKIHISASLWTAVFFLISCQSVQRNPASSHTNKMPDELAKLYELEVELINLQEQSKKAQGGFIDSSAEERISQEINKKLQDKEKLIDELKRQNAASSVLTTFDDQSYGIWGTKIEEVTLNDFNLYKLGSPSLQNRFFAMANINTRYYELVLKNEFFHKQLPTLSLDEGKRLSSRYLEASIHCDGAFALKQDLLGFQKYQAFKTARFRWYDAKLNGLNIRFRPSPEVKSCDITFTNPWDQKAQTYAFSLKSEKQLLKNFSTLPQAYEGCLLPLADNLTKPQKFFLNPNYSYMNCPVSLNGLKTLEDSEEGMQAKVEMLLGKKLPKEFMKQRDPFPPLDFSQAPKLDVIFISYLVFRSDYYGNVLARLLKYHADRGTQVRILVSDVISLKKDKALFAALNADNGNIKVVLYRYDNSAKSGGFIHEFHRTNHVKIFLTLSSTQASANKVVLGGRNIHDAFVFKQPSSFSSPVLIDYLHGEESFVHWRDFEVLVDSKAFAEKVATQFYALWMQDSVNFSMKPTTTQAVTSSPLPADYFAESSKHPLIRHYVSIPFKDGQILEDYYAELINHADKKILISSPYFRPVRKVGEALMNAVKRGVKITLITRLDLDGDTADFILSAVNKDGVNKFKDSIKIYEYTEPKAILHSKLVMIDDEMTFLGSINLNKRSFVHDMENAALVYSPEFNKQMTEIYKEYLTQARIITEKQKVYFWQRLIIGLFDTEF